MAYKKISPLDFYFAINGSYWSNEMVSSGFLPDNCLHISMDRKEKFFTIWNPELRADVMYQDIEYFNFPIPPFGIWDTDAGFRQGSRSVPWALWRMKSQRRTTPYVLLPVFQRTPQQYGLHWK